MLANTIMVYTTKNPSKMSVRQSVALVSLYLEAKQQNTTDSAIAITKIPSKAMIAIKPSTPAKASVF